MLQSAYIVKKFWVSSNHMWIQGKNQSRYDTQYTDTYKEEYYNVCAGVTLLVCMRYLFTHKNHRVIPLSSSCIIYTYRWTHSKGCVRLFRACKQLFWILPSHPDSKDNSGWELIHHRNTPPRATHYTGTMEQGDKKTNTPFFGQ